MAVLFDFCRLYNVPAENFFPIAEETETTYREYFGIDSDKRVKVGIYFYRENKLYVVADIVNKNVVARYLGTI